MDDLIVYFLPPDVIKLIRQYEPYVHIMHLSDQNVTSPFASAATPTVARKSLQFRFKIPPTKEDLEALIGLVLRTLDLVSVVVDADCACFARLITCTQDGAA